MQVAMPTIIEIIEAASPSARAITLILSPMESEDDEIGISGVGFAIFVFC
jgi:hypothetical protein